MRNEKQLLILLDFLQKKAEAEHGFEHPELKFNFSDINNEEIPNILELENCLRDIDAYIKLGEDPHAYKLFNSYSINGNEVVICDITVKRIEKAYEKINDSYSRYRIVCKYDSENKIATLYRGQDILVTFSKGIGFIVNYLYLKQNDEPQNHHTVQFVYNKAIGRTNEDEICANDNIDKTLTSQKFNTDIRKINSVVNEVSKGKVKELIDIIPGRTFNSFKWKKYI